MFYQVVEDCSVFLFVCTAEFLSGKVKKMTDDMPAPPDMEPLDVEPLDVEPLYMEPLHLEPLYMDPRDMEPPHL